MSSLQKLASTMPRAQLTVIPRAGHLMPLRQPIEVAQAIAAVS
jgi:pimeloyl-ACP methyl ester carboxylesterase